MMHLETILAENAQIYIRYKMELKVINIIYTHCILLQIFQFSNLYK